MQYAMSLFEWIVSFFIKEEKSTERRSHGDRRQHNRRSNHQQRLSELDTQNIQHHDQIEAATDHIESLVDELINGEKWHD